MYLMFTDETNNTASEQAKFFIYGGLIVPVTRIQVLSAKIEDIRINAGYSVDDCLKFDTNARPDHVSREECTEAKKRVLHSCIEEGCKFIAYFVLHQIAKNRDPRELVTWAADHVIGRFNMYLQEKDSQGICLIDSLPVDKQFQYLSDKFTTGLDLPGENLSLNRIQVFGATVINASQISSAMDIVLGSLRYAVNDPANKEAAKSMMEDVARMMWYREHQGEKYLGDRGVILRPKLNNIEVEAYRQGYQTLTDYLQSLIADVD